MNIMKKYRYSIIMGLFFCLILFGPVRAFDYVVEFKAEHYKQTNLEYSNFPEVYHSIQVHSTAGPKLLILTGDDHQYRTWLRQYIAAKASFIVKVPDDDNDRFISSKAYNIDVKAVHPYNAEKWSRPGPATSDYPVIHGDKRILVIDANNERAKLMADVIDRTGYRAAVFTQPAKAYAAFRQQPGKFEMIIVDHDTPGAGSEEFVKKILDIDHKIPIMIGTTYRDTDRLKELSDTFATAGSVMVVPVILKDLKNRIQGLLDRKV